MGTWRPWITLVARRGEPSLRFQNKKISARATALALVLGVVGVLVTALPASASTDHVVHPDCGVAGHGGDHHRNRLHRDDRGHVQRGGSTGEVVRHGSPGDRAVPPVPRRGRSSSTTPAADTPSAANFITAAAAPTITSFPPTAVRSGRVVITGTNFGCTTSVMFNTTAATTYVVELGHTDHRDGADRRHDRSDACDDLGGGPRDSATNFTVVAGPDHHVVHAHER